MSSAATAARARILPHGPLDLIRQLAIWFGFLFAYRYTRGVADRDAFQAFQNGLRVADFEHRITGLWELSLQSFVASSNVLREATSLTYWHSQFTVLGLVLLWVYLRRNDHFVPLRNTILLANVIGLIGFVADADGAAAHVPGARLRRHARQLRHQPQQRDRPGRREPVRGDAQPPRRRLADHRRRALLHRPLQVGEGALAALAALGLVLA